VAHVERLSHVPETALARELGVDWSPHEENTARLYEVLHHWLGLEWIDRTTDPDDPEVRRRRAEDKRRSVKPPPYPLVPPVALRPDQIAEKRHAAYLDEVQRWSAPQVERRNVGSDEFDRIMGLG
jgi:hypothetical protein